MALRATYLADARTAAPTIAVATVTLSIVDWSPTLGVIPSRAKHEYMCVKEKKTLPSREKKNRLLYAVRYTRPRNAGKNQEKGNSRRPLSAQMC